jgi:prevent-host-death family protein
MKNMSTVGIRALKQNASQVIAEVAKGARIVVTDRGRAVAQLSPISHEPLDALLETGRVRPRRGSLADIPAPEPGASLSAALQDMRAEERY